MYNIERKRKIIELIEINKSVDVAELSNMFNVSKETIRRDLTDLEEDGILQRTHGGAIIAKDKNELEFSVSIREMYKKEEKNIICKRAAEFIHDGDTIFVDNSSTTINLLKYINRDYQVNVITNSIKVLLESTVINNHNLTLICIGGVFRINNLSLIGPLAQNNVKQFYPSKTFVSARGISQDCGFTDSSVYELEAKKTIINNSKEVFMLMDSSKFNQVGVVQLGGFEIADYLITDGNVDENVLEAYKDKVKIIIA